MAHMRFSQWVAIDLRKVENGLNPLKTSGEMPPGFMGRVKKTSVTDPACPSHAGWGVGENALVNVLVSCYYV